MAKGDHLTVSRGWYQHHGLDLGDGRVAQFGAGAAAGGGDPCGCRVEVLSIERFALGATVRVLAGRARFDADEVVRRAFSRLGEQDYGLFANNCEHFVTWCRTGNARSRQIDRVMQRSGAAATKVASGAVARAATRSSARAATRSFGRLASPWLLAADAAQFGAEVAALRLGATEAKAESTGQAIGIGASIGIGATAGGPVGAVAGAVLWGIGEIVGKSLRPAGASQPGRPGFGATSTQAGVSSAATGASDDIRVESGGT